MLGKYTSTREMISFIPVITPSQFPSHTFFIYLPADDISFFSLRPRGKKGTKTLWTLLFYGDIFPHSNPIQKLQEPKKNILCWEILCFAKLLLMKQKWHGSSDRLSWSLFKAWLAFTRFALVRLVPPVTFLGWLHKR